MAFRDVQSNSIRRTLLHLLFMFALIVETINDPITCIISKQGTFESFNLALPLKIATLFLVKNIYLPYIELCKKTRYSWITMGIHMKQQWWIVATGGNPLSLIPILNNNDLPAHFVRLWPQLQSVFQYPPLLKHISLTNKAPCDVLSVKNFR